MYTNVKRALVVVAVIALASYSAVPVMAQVVAPITSDTTVSVGTILSGLVATLVATFGSAVAIAGTNLLLKMGKIAGLQVTDALKAQLQGVIVNGLNAAAKDIQTGLAGKITVDVKSRVVAETVTYAQTHGGDILKKLGVDPMSGAAVEAIKARIETAIADPLAPTALTTATIKTP